MDDTPELGQEDPEQMFIDFAELVAALGDIVPTEGLVNAEGVLSARDFYDWFMHDGQTVLSRGHVLFPEPNRLREIARFLELAASVGESAGAK
jgi:hypothetical protein